MFIKIAVSRLYSQSMFNHNPEFVSHRISGRKVSFNRGDALKFESQANNFRYQDLPTTIVGTIENFRDSGDTLFVSVNPEVTCKINACNAFFEDLSVAELETELQLLNETRAATEQLIEGVSSLKKYMEENNLDVISRKVLLRERVASFVSLATSQNVDPERITKGIEDLIEMD